MTTPSPYELRSPVTPDEWEAYHTIRRQVLFELRGHSGIYDADHPDERRPGNYPKLLTLDGLPLAVIRIDLEPPRATFRRVAVRAEMQRRGHGTVSLALAEIFAHSHGCTEVLSSVDPAAVEFYAKRGYRITSADRGANTPVPMAKRFAGAEETAGEQPG